MPFQNIVIVGPTSSGKTDLANFLASNSNTPVFNCDSVQIYKDLNYLSNKPEFLSQEIISDEKISFIKPVQLLDFSKYEKFLFKVTYRKDSEIFFEEIESDQFLKFLINKNIVSEKINSDIKPISNYLFDILNIGESYSISNFKSDINRISEKFKISQKIIVGGTIYYAYHYIFNTEISECEFQLPLQKKDLSNSELIKFLEEKDPESLNILDKSNSVRLYKAYEFVLQTGKKFSQNYFKKQNLIQDFMLISIIPKNREEYTENLNKIVKSRLNQNALSEIEFLSENYIENIDWIKKISYEYRYAFEVFDLVKSGEYSLDSFDEILKILQAKERQYTKRQMVFIKKLNEDLKSYIWRP